MVLTLSNPDHRNALGPEIYAAGVEALNAADSNPEVRSVVITGEGSTFCAGGNLQRLQDNRSRPPEVQAQSIEGLHGWIEAIRTFPKPVIAAVEGAAAGAGFSLALACDLRVMAESAFVTTAYVKLGLSGDYGASWFLTRLVGPARAREILFLGERLSSADCLALGLANRVTPDAALASEALALARRLANGPPLALAAMKDNLNRALGESLEALLALEAERMVDGATSEDYVEAVRAFEERRPPVFKGK
jgi:enoyl-CoA hydratase/carnithine racemase